MTILSRLLESGRVITHPLIIGELACGNLKSREKNLQYLNDLPHAQEVLIAETTSLIEECHSFGKRVGLIDFMLLATTIFTPEAMLWPADKGLHEQARRPNRACGPVND